MTPWLHLETPLLGLTLSPVVNNDLYAQFALVECSKKAGSGHLHITWFTFAIIVYIILLLKVTCHKIFRALKLARRFFFNGS